MPSTDDVQPELALRADDGPYAVTAADVSPPRGNPFPIVGVGASAGGLEAFEQFLSALPDETGMAFVLVQHLDPLHESLLADILRVHCRLPVSTAHDKTAVEPDSVYVIPPNASIALEDGHLRLGPREEGLHLPIDKFFRSLAKVQGSRAIGVVLSGNASDGSMGLRAIKAECGITFAQDEATARFSGMPRNAVATGAVDFVMTPAQIAQQLGQLGRHPYLITPQPGRADAETLPDGDRDLKRIFALLQNATRVDFSHYKHTTVRRRIGRRIMVLRMQNLGEYVRFCEQHPAELRELYRDLLISVTNFFRDPEAFDALAQLLTKAISDRANAEQPVRLWVPGCATGEEVYSHAMSIFEFLQANHLSAPMQIFGTDISELALERARHGIYSEAIKQDVSPARLSRFFTRVDGGGYQISKVLRESCIFARHDVTKDPPFSHLDLVSCRNVLIYLDGKLHHRLFPLFHYALDAGGLLLLGSAESAASAPDLFEPLDSQHHIYRRKEAAVRLSLEERGSVAPAASPSAEPRSAVLGISDLQRRVDRIIQSKYGPAAVLVDSELRILQFRGHTSPYLDPKPGEASLNLLHMARESLVVPLRRSIRAAAEQKFSVRENDVDLEESSPGSKLTLEVTPIIGTSPSERYYVIAFLPQAESADVLQQSPAEVTAMDSRTRQLERELAETREYLRNLTEDYEAHSEELRAANEEARSANEELQSTNEELGTTKEELQSTNEELTTVNEELQNRNKELTATNSDFRNLLGAVSLGILMIDQDLRVRRFNSAAEKLFELSASDLGRPVSHIHGRIETPKLEQQVRTVIESLRVLEQELRDADGRWYSMTIRPYRTLDDHIAGAVVTLQDIDPLKRGLEAAEEARDYAEGMIETVRQPLVVLDADLRVQRATPAFYETFRVSREETEGRLLYDLGNGQWNQPRLREVLGAALFRQQTFHDYQVEHDFPNIGWRIMRLNARRIPRQDPNHRMLLLAIEDMTERREEAEVRFQRLFETAKDGIIVVDAETEAVADVNPYFLELTGFTREEIVGRPFAEAPPLLEIPELRTFVAVTRDREVIRCDDVRLVTRTAKEVWVDLTGNRYQVGTQPVVQFNLRDISARRQAARALQQTEERFGLFVESVRDYALFQLDTNGLIVSWNSGAERLLGWKEEEVVGKPSAIVFKPDDVERGEPAKELETARAVGRAQDERWHIRKDGSLFFASGVLTQVCDENVLRGFAKIMRDITESKEQEEQLRASVNEKTMLVREIHHRVKNNLQVIVSLLSLQSHQVNKPELLAAFEETEARVRAIAKIHERLYASDDLTEVEFGTYLTHLANELVGLFATVPNAVKVNVAVQEMVLHIEQAIPLGLIANELIINSLKHGLNGAGGKLDVTLAYLPEGIQPEMGQTLDDGWGQVRIRDSGAGFPPNTDMSGSSTMGFRLVNLLMRQLRARLEIADGPGADILVTFPLTYK